MNCQQTSERLSAYLDGELSAEGADRVREHLLACPQCAAELDELKRLNDALGTLDGMATPADFARRVREAAERPREPIRLFDVADGRWSRVLTRVAALFLMAAGLWVGMMAGDAASRGKEPAPAAETSELDLSMELLSAAPSGSLADIYLTFLDESEWGGAQDVQ